MMFAHALLLAGFLSPIAPVETAAEAVAKQVLAEGSKLFDAKDAKALAETYTPDGQVTLYAPKDGALTAETREGRAAIEAAYREFFGNAEPHSRNDVETARFAGPDILIIQGKFCVDTTSANADFWPFVQVRVKQADKWLLRDLQLFLVKE